MKTYIIHYAFKRYNEWFTDSTEIRTRLFNDHILENIMRKEIEVSEMVPVTILEIRTIK